MPYTYLIGWSHLDRWYYGCQYNKAANPSDLWNTYFTSSEVVKEYRQKYGEPDIIEVRKTFFSKKQVLLWEEKVLSRLNAANSEKWLNKHNGGRNFRPPKVVWNKGLSKNDPRVLLISFNTSETRKKMSLARKGKYLGDENIAKKPEVREKISMKKKLWWAEKKRLAANG